QLSHDLGGLTYIRFAERDADGRGDHHELGVELAVVCIAFGRQLHKLRALVLRIADKFCRALQPQAHSPTAACADGWSAASGRSAEAAAAKKSIRACPGVAAQ